MGQPNPESLVIKGHVYLTNLRVVVLSDEGEDHDSFALLYPDVIDFKLNIPWFGSNKYEIKFKISNSNGGLNYLYPWIAILEFQYGGAPKFSGIIEDLLKRSVQTEDLPRYSEI